MKGPIDTLGGVADVVLSYRPNRHGAQLAEVSPLLQSETGLVTLAAALGAATAAGKLSNAEAALLKSVRKQPSVSLAALRSEIRNGADPLGEAFTTIRTSEARRKDGAVYTPRPIVNAMLDWAADFAIPDRVVDPGAGSGRFVLEAGRRFPGAELVAIETDPLAALMARANLAAAGMADRAVVRFEDFRTAQLPEIPGRTLYIGNPPYVRHHLIDPKWKRWLRIEAAALKLRASQLAGLHVYFFLSIARRAKAKDYGALITAAEWLDVNYGKLVRELFLDRLGGQAVYVIEPEAVPFPGTATTAAVTTFSVNGKPSSARFARIDKLSELNHLSGGRRVSRERLRAQTRWSHFTRKRTDVPHGYIELGELCRVHRGQVTGANRIWIAGEHSAELPDRVKFPTVTTALELFRSGETLTDATALRRVIDLPADLSEFSGKARDAIDRFLELAERMGARNTYVATHRKAWWSVGLREPAPVLATYMARRPPTFVLNVAEARHLNIAHGLYPRLTLSRRVLSGLVLYLRGASTLQGGRMYAGGLTKFEPREMERIPVPEPGALVEIGAA